MRRGRVEESAGILSGVRGPCRQTADPSTPHLVRKRTSSSARDDKTVGGNVESSVNAGASSNRMTKIHIPTPLRQYAGKQATIEIKAGTIGDALSGLISKHPDLRRHLYTDEGKLRAFVNVYLNDEDVRYLQKEATAVKDSDTISIVPSIAGGAAGLTIS